MSTKQSNILYIQGQWKCQIVKEYENSYDYIPLEGYGYGQKGKVFTASKDLFQKERKVKEDGR
jgi:hypothetical protein